jgi:UPF0755 protein
VRQRNRESVSTTDEQELFFGPDDEYGDHDGFGLDAFADHDADQGAHGQPYGPAAGHPTPAPAGAPRETRLERSRRSRRRRNRGFGIVLALLLVVLIGAVGWFAGRPVWRYFHPSNYQGAGTGSVEVVVHPGDTASDIGSTLYADGVVASKQAFVDAAKNDPASTGIGPGTYVLHHHMNAGSALNLLLSPSARVNNDIVIPEGATVADIEKRLTAPRCTATSAPGTVCGLGLPKASVDSALEHVAGLGLPTDYTADGKTPSSVEGFLYPATYPFDGKTTAVDALGQMIGTFTDRVRSTNFTARARSLHISPYQELIIASIAQAEAKFPRDMPKVARVILNRLDAHKPLQVDATSAYACKLAGTAANKCIYADAEGAYNTYKHTGLPPTPIGNPGQAALKAAAHPAQGNWLYYVNDDAAGHLGFFHDDADFEKAVQKCKARGWCQ